MGHGKGCRPGLEASRNGDGKVLLQRRAPVRELGVVWAGKKYGADSFRRVDPVTGPGRCPTCARNEANGDRDFPRVGKGVLEVDIPM